MLFIEEKVKLCEGKYSKNPALEGSDALLGGQTRCLARPESAQPLLVLLRASPGSGNGVGGLLE